MSATAGSERCAIPLATPSLFQLVAALIRAGEAGDQARFDELFDVCVTHVYGIAWRSLRDQARTEEATQRFLIAAVSSKR